MKYPSLLLCKSVNRFYKLLLFLGVFTFQNSLSAQVINDECDNAIDLGEGYQCPFPDVFTNVGATTSSIFSNPNDNVPACFQNGSVEQDVWFSFTVPSDGSVLDYEILVTGVAGMNAPISQPQISIYRGECGLDELVELVCASAAATESSVEAEVIGLTPGLTYFIRINDWDSAGNDNAGDFEICLQEPTSDTPDDLPWDVDPLCGSIITDGIAAVSCGVYESIPPAERWTFGLMNFNVGLPAVGRQDLSGSVQMYHHPSWHVDSIGNVFGVTVDNQGNIYAAASSNYSSGYFTGDAIIRYGEIGGGAEDVSAAGTIYKIDAISGQATVFTVLPQQSGSFTQQACEAGNSFLRNTGPGLGNLTFNYNTGHFYATNFEDGRIYRLNSEGEILDSYDPFDLDDGAEGAAILTELAYGLDVAPDGLSLFFGNAEDQFVPFGSGSPEIFSIPLNPDGSFSGTIDNTSLPFGATWDNYVGDETFHFAAAIGSTFAGTGMAISDLEFTPEGKLLVGGRTICNQSIHNSYNHGGQALVLSENGSGLFSVNEGNIFTGYDFSLGQSSECYGGVSARETDDGTVVYALSSADMLEEPGPHGIHLSEAGVYGGPLNPASPAGIVSYGGDPFNFEDPKGIGGDVKFFVVCATIDDDCTLEEVDAGDDFSFCFDDQTVQLNGSVAGQFSSVEWSPAAGLSNPFILNPTVQVTETTTFTLAAFGQGIAENLIINGDFEAGLTGFTSDYEVGMGGPFGILSNEGTYAVTTNSTLVHDNWAACTDNSGNGNMLAVNGATVADESIWCQTVTVEPNTGYEFSAWLATLITTNPPILQFSINGDLLGLPFGATAVPCEWNQFFSTWNSGTTTTAEICITNQNIGGNGNDFGIDDITFGAVCTETDQVTVTVIEPLAEAVSEVDLPCDGGNTEVVLDGTGSSTGAEVSYLWTTTSGNIVSGETSLMPTVDAAGTYALTVSIPSDFGICTATTFVNVAGDTTDLTLPADVALCLGESFTFDVTGFQSYAWSPSAGLSCDDCPNPVATPTESTVYTLVATTAEGCEATGSTEIIVFPLTNTALTLAACEGEIVTFNGEELAVNSVTDFTFFDQNGCDSVVTVTVEELAVITENLTLSACEGTTANYNGTDLEVNSTTEFTFVSNNGCDSIVTVFVEELPNFATAVSLSACSGETVLFNGTELTPNSVTDFSFVASNGCDSVVTVTVTELATFAFDLSLAACPGETIIYNENELLPNTTTDFTFIAQNGCDSIVTVTVAALMNIETSEDLAICEGESVDIFGVSTSDGGTFSMTFAAANGCDSTHTVTLTVNDSPEVVLAGTSELACFGGLDGMISSTVSGGTMPYSYLWNNGSTSSELNNIGAGNYSLTVTDVNGCVAMATFQINQPAALLLELEVQNVSCENLGFVTAEAIGGTPPYSLLWSTGETNESIENLLAGNYAVTLTDYNGCELVSSFTVLGELAPEISLSIDDLPTLDDPLNGALSVVIMGGNPPFTQVWNTGSTAIAISDLATGEYSVTVTDNNDCTATATTNLFIPGCIEGEIWEDLNRDGCNDAGEDPIADFELQLIGTDIFGNAISLTTTTENDGEYSFAPLPPGTFQITYVDIMDFAASPTDACDNDNEDSDFDENMATLTVTLAEGDCPQNLDGGLFDACLNVIDPGTICCDQILCGPGNVPDPITSLTPATGAGGPIEYMWMQSNSSNQFGTGIWTPVPNSDSPDYSPGVLDQTTFYARCVRAVGCDNWLETNVVEIFVDDIAVAFIEGPNFLCVGDMATYSALDNGSNATYEWDFGLLADPQTATGQEVQVTWNFFTTGYITLSVTKDGCTSMDDYYVAVSNSTLLCGSNLMSPAQSPTAYQVFPNPVQNELTINWERNLSGEIQFSLSTVDGKLIRQSLVDGAALQTQIQVSDLMNGMYLLQIQDEEGDVSLHKVVKF